MFGLYQVAITLFKKKKKNKKQYVSVYIRQSHKAHPVC